MTVSMGSNAIIVKSFYFTAPIQPPQMSADYLKRTNKVDEQFNNRLKQVFVTSVNKVKIFHIQT